MYSQNESDPAKRVSVATSHASRIPVSPNGQITVPKRFREKLGVSGGDKLLIEENDDGQVVLKPVPHPDELRGLLAGATDDDGRDPLEVLRESRQHDHRESAALTDRGNE